MNDNQLKPSSTPSKPEAEDDLLSGLDNLDALAEAAEALEGHKKRFAICIDATSSMWPYWRQAKGAMIKILDELQHRSAYPFEVQLVAYRDQTCDDRPIEASGWSNDVLYLKDWCENIGAHGGGDYPESVDLALKHLLNDGLDQIIMIADAPGRPETPGYDEAQAFGQRQVKIYPLYAGQEESNVAFWKRIAKLSGGKAFPLTDSENMADVIAVLLTKGQKALAITYQATSIEGKRISEEMDKED